MTWLYVPETSSACVQASEDSNSASCSPSTVAERLVAGSVTWRGKPQQPQAWSRRWTQGGFIRLLSGPTCSPSTLDRGVAAFISSLAATPAKTTALPERAQDRAEAASSRPRSAVMPKSAGLILSSAKTCRGTRTDNSKPSSRHWSDWATALRQEYSVRPKPEIPCAANDCSSWPAPRTTSHHGPGEHGQGGKDLQTEVSEWKAPGQAEHWMTPMTADTGEKVTHATKQYSLIHQAERDFCHPSSFPGLPIDAGTSCSTGSPNTNQPSAKRKLNPIFVEALMRWPTGLSGFERQETAWTRWWLLMPSYLSQLCTTKPEPQPDLFAFDRKEAA